MVSTQHSPDLPDLAERVTERLAEQLAEVQRVRGRSLWRDARGRFLRNRAASLSALVLVAIVAFVFLGPLFAVWSNEEIDWARMGDIPGLGFPSLESGHYFGLDPLGRDLFARTIQATGTSITVGVVGTLVAVVIGTLWGAVAGYAGGLVDGVMMRAVDILIAVPYMFIIILLMVAFDRSFIMLFVGIGATTWLPMSRIVRGQTLTLKQREFVEAARAGGVGSTMIVWRHILPNLLGVVVVYATLLVPELILVESFISFLGLGVSEPATSLGKLIAEGAGTVMYGTIWQLLVPLAFFMTLILCLFFVGDGLRDALDPRDR